MRSLKINRTRISKRALTEAADVLRDGGVAVFPTETAYGLAVDPRNARAVAEVFRIKGRSTRKSLPYVAASVAAVRKHFQLKGAAAKLAARHWPGPLTLILPFKKGSAIAKACGEKTGAVRVPSSAWARAIAKAAGGIATSTSANVSGAETLYKGTQIVKEFNSRKRKPSLLLDAGALPKRAPSTIVGFLKGNALVIRQGSVRIS